MARIRSIKPEYWGDFETAERLSRDARLLYVALWNFCDEHARMAGDARYVKGHCFPYDDDLDAAAVTALLDELERVGNVVRYTVDQAPYLFLPNLHKHQRLEPAKVPSRLPPPPEPDSSERRADESARDADQSGTSVALQVAGSRLQAAGSKGADAHTTPPPPVDNLPGELAILRAKLDARKLQVRWDKLDADQVTEIQQLVELHGDGPLVKAALNAYRPNDPPVFAQAWLSDWRLLRPPGTFAVVASPSCPVRGHSGTVAHCVQCAADRLAGDA